jgi:ABC-type amino acid transport substrate-binding protein
LTLLAGLSPAWAATLVKVGAYEFPPFVEGRRGVTHDLVALLNEVQSDYRFVVTATSARRRYQDFDRGAFDLMFFESLQWGWEGRPIDSTPPYLRGDGEVYVALAAPGRDQSFFERLSARSLVVVNGYHYGFADYVSDKDQLRKRFDITFADTPEAMLRMLFAGRAEVAVVTRSYLDAYRMRDPKQVPELLVSERFDQLYAHAALLRKGGPISATTLDGLIKTLDRTGRLTELWARHGIGAAKK